MTNTTKSEECKRKLIEAAGQIFATVGYEAATVRQITERAEVNIASINYYFGDKQELYRTVLQTVTSSLVLQLRESCTASTPKQRLSQFVHTILRIKSKDELPWAPLLMAREINELNEAQSGFLVEAVRPLHLLAEQIVRDLVRDAAPEKVTLAASLLVALCINRPSQQKLDQMLSHNLAIDSDLETTADLITSFALAGIRSMCAQ